MSTRKVKTLIKVFSLFVFSYRSSREGERLRERLRLSIKVVEKFQNLAAKCCSVPLLLRVTTRRTLRKRLFYSQHRRCPFPPFPVHETVVLVVPSASFSSSISLYILTRFALHFSPLSYSRVNNFIVAFREDKRASLKRRGWRQRWYLHPFC